MKFKPAKSSSFIMKKGRKADNFRFSLSGTTIPTLLEYPVKNLGKIFNNTLRDTHAVRASVGDLEFGLTRVDKSGICVGISARSTPQDFVAVICL